MTLETGVKELAEAVGADVKALANDPRLTDSREWSEETVAQEEAEAGTASTRRAWTAQRVRQAINAWWQLVTSGFGRNFITASNEQAARNVLQLTYPATAPTVGAGVGVLRDGAYGISGSTLDSERTPTGFARSLRTKKFAMAAEDYEVGSGIPSGIAIGSGGADFSANYTGLYVAVNERRVFVYNLKTGETVPVFAEIYTTGNLLNIGTTAASARTALNLFADSSGIITSGSGALTNDVSEFLSLNTYADMSAKIQGVHSYVELSNNSTSSTPMAGYYYLLPRNNEYALTHTFTCTYSATTVKTWRMLVTRSWSTSISVSPNFAVTGLSGSVKIWGTFQNAYTHVLIEFTQIGQNVIGQTVAQWN